MFRNFNRSFAFAIALGVAACADPNALNKKNAADGASSTFLAVCQLSNGQSPVVCIDFPTDNSNNSASCTTVEYPTYQSFGANSEEYQGVGNTANATTSCAAFNSNSTKIGSCTLADRFIRYYSGHWSLSTAQSNCTSRNGQWGS